MFIRKKLYQKFPLSVFNYGDVQIQASPFPHMVIPNFFKPWFYQALCEEYNSLLAKGVSEDPASEGFKPFPRGEYYGYSIVSPPSFPMDLFVTPQWQNYFAQQFQLQLDNNLILGLHYHKPDSAACGVHHDHNLCSFEDKPLANGMNLHNGQIPYFVDKTKPYPTDLLLTYRKLAIIFYMNDDWQPGDGGETGLYLSRESTEPVKTINPVGNTLLAFAISDHSFHAFLKNGTKPRKTLHQWFHGSS